MNIIEKKTEELIHYARNPRKNDQAVDAVAASIKEFGFKVPIIVDSDDVIVCGHTRVKAAQKLGLESVPCVIADDLSPAQIKAYRVLDNKLAEKAAWDLQLLQLELQEMDLTSETVTSAFDASELAIFMQADWNPPTIDPDGPHLKVGGVEPINLTKEQRDIFEKAAAKVREDADEELTDGEVLEVICQAYLN
jgi:site-specific DNA-methyltransferase (adenine-specific)